MSNVIHRPPLHCRLALALAVLAAVVVGPAVTCASAAGLLIADGGFGGALEIKEQAVKVTINNGIAVTEIEQVFVNTENRVVEALYTFPVPAGASVANFSMWIGGKEMIGEVVEKERARQIYESYKQVRRDPGLLEQVDFKRFEMRIFPIAAGAEQRVRLAYYQELEFDHDWATYVYPLATVTRREATQRTTGRFAFNLDIKSEVPIVELSSPSHGDALAVVKQSEQGYWQASLETKAGDLSRDVVLACHLERPQTGVDLAASRTAGEDGYFQLTLTAGKELEQADQGSDYVFVLDVSGSMAFDGKLGLSRGAVAAFLAALRSEDRFELLVFNVSPQTLFGQLQAPDQETKQLAADFLESQKARGGTVLRPALETAYRYRNSDRPLNVVVLSDGMTEQQEQRELLELIRQRPSGTTVFCVGVGNEVNRPLLSQLAEGAGGLAAFVSQGDDFQRQADSFRRKLTRPAMTDLKIDFSGAEVYDVEPQQLPNLYHGQPLRLYGRYRAGAQGQAATAGVKIAANVSGNPIQQSVEFLLPKLDDRNPQIERMWASHRVERLMREARAAGSPGSTRDEIVRLCEGYSIASEYASFIVLENDVEYARWKIDRRNASRIRRDRQAQDVVRKQLESLRRQSEARLGPAPADLQLAVNPTNANSPAGGSNPAADLPSPAGPIQPPGDAGNRSGGASRDVSFGGGGAVDPLTALAGAALLGASAWARRRNRRGRDIAKNRVKVDA